MTSYEDKVPGAVGQADQPHLDSALAGAIFAAAVDAILVVDGQGLIQAANDAALVCFGYAETELLGRNISILMPRSDAVRHDAYMHDYQHTGKRKIIGIGRELMGRRKSGDLFPLHLSISEFQFNNQRMFVGICHDISERHRLSEQVAFLASYDSLTGCLNRHQFQQSLSEAMRPYQTDGQRQAVLFIDLDDFKAINDNHGHGGGDRLLRQAAERLRGALPKSCLLGRVGGDEFAVLMPFDGGMNRASEIAHQLLHALRKPFDIDGRLLTVRASIGISLFQGGCQTADDLLNEADMAMYQAKRDGGACARFFDQTLRERAERTYRLLTRLRQAIEAQSFELHYQLQVDLQTRQPTGIEALLRWRDEGGQLIAPDEFLPVAHAYGLMPEIDRWVLQRACRDNMTLIRSGVLDVPVAVNISVPSFSAADFVSRVRQTLADTGLPPERLALELTEETAMSSLKQVRQNSDLLIRAGVSLSIDDFGVGFSSPSRLKELHFHTLKIDRSFVAGVPQSSSDVVIIQATLGLAAALGMRVVAEGIETAEQAEYLCSLGCAQGQGYWFARPLPLAQLQQRLVAQETPDGTDEAG